MTTAVPNDPDRLPPARLAELAAFGEEAAAFADAGLPLELGLGGGRAGGLSDRVARRLRDGRSLADAYAAEAGPLPAAMRAALESGVRSGNPGAALARLARHARLTLDLRTELNAAMVGPLAVVGAAAALAAWVLPRAAVPLAATLRQAGAEVSGPVRLFERLGRADPLWLWAAPAVAVLFAVLLGRLTGWRALGWLPGLRGVRRELRWAGCSHLLSLLTAAGVPLGEALRLAAGVNGNRAGGNALTRAADRLDAGEDRAAVFAPRSKSAPAPPLLAWVLATVGAPDLPAALAETAAAHGRRARAAAGRCAAAWPLGATALVGGGVLLVYVLGVAGPAADLLDALTRPLTGGPPR